MAIENVLASVAVKDLGAARAWYTRLFDGNHVALAEAFDSSLLR
jgi:hypothetical protein